MAFLHCRWDPISVVVIYLDRQLRITHGYITANTIRIRADNCTTVRIPMVDVIALHHTHMIHIRAARWAVEDLADPHGDDPHGDDPNYRYIAQQSATAVVDAVKVHINPTLCVLIFGTRFEMPRDRRVVFLPCLPSCYEAHTFVPCLTARTLPSKSC